MPTAGDLDAHTSALRTTAAAAQLVSRILTVSASPADLSGQYVALMNGVFAAQRLGVPIDMLRVGPRTAFLQQASDATGGVFLEYDPLAQAVENGHVSENGDKSTTRLTANEAAAGLLQTLMMAYLSDVTARKYLVPAGSAEVDFRAACFCHGKVVSLGGVCSVCLSSKSSSLPKLF
jgi:transcription initiation factor TFIIH subunit 3